MTQLVDILRERGRDDRPALFCDAESLTYAQLWSAVTAARDRLAAAGVAAGDKVVVALSNTPAFPVAVMALSDLGAVSIPLNPSLAEKERARILAIAQPSFVIGFQGHQRVVTGGYLTKAGAHPAEPEAELDGISTIVFTSGTTGAPKGVLLTAEALLANAASVIEYLQLTEEDRTLIFLPLFYSYPMSQLLTAWMTGGAVVLMKNLMYPAQAIKLIDRYGVTGLGGVPTSLSLLSNQSARPARRLRYVMSAGGPLSPSLVKKLDEVFPGAAVFNNYGCTEIGPRATAVNYMEHPDRIGSIGRAIANVELRLIRPDFTEAEAGETAEIVLNGPSLMKGYYRDPETTAARMSRWGFHTGDYAYADEDGFLFFQGRHDDVFKCGGEKVSAREIEDVILEHHGVLEAAVVAQADPVMGHVAVAYVVRVEDGGPSEADLQMFCRRKLSIHKVPRFVHFLDKLERSANGKIQKYRLRELAEGRDAQEAGRKGASL